MTDEMNVPAVHAEAERAVPSKPAVKKPAARKASQRKSAELSLPTVYNANGTPNLVLMSTMKSKFPTLVLVKTADATGEKSPVQVLENKALGDLVQYVAAIVTSYCGGTGIAADGATIYASQYADTVLRAVPNFKDYDVVFVTAQSGAMKNRIPVPVLIAMAKARAEWVKRNINKYGLTKTAHTKSSSKPSTVALA